MLAERARAVEALREVVDVCQPEPTYQVELSESDVDVPVWPVQARNASDAEDMPEPETVTEEEGATEEAEEEPAEPGTTEEDMPTRRSDLCPTCQEVLTLGSWRNCARCWARRHLACLVRCSRGDEACGRRFCAGCEQELATVGIPEQNRFLEAHHFFQCIEIGNVFWRWHCCLQEDRNQW